MRIPLLSSLLPFLLLHTVDARLCPFGTWQDQNEACHFGSPPGDPIGWTDRYGRPHPPGWVDQPASVIPGGSSSYTFSLPDGTRVTISDKRYNRANNPALFFDADWSYKRDIQPLRDIPGGVPYLYGLDWNFARRMRVAHGVLSSLAFVILFPLGAIVVNLGSGALGVGAHVGFQILGWVFYLVGAAAGLWMASAIRWQSFSFFNNYHAIIGIVLLILLFLQPILGIIGHIGYRRHQRRSFFGFFHAWLGRLIVMLGIINGGLGLMIAGNASRGQVTAYAVIAALMFAAWVLAALFGALKRHRKDVPRRPKERHIDSPMMTGPGRK